MEPIGQVIRVPDMRAGYVALVKAVAEHGAVVSPRGMPTREFHTATIILTNPWDALPVGVGRGLVPGIAAVESAQLLAGQSWPELVVKVGPQFANYAEDNGEFHGAYGPRTRGQFAAVVERLREDPSTRQAVVTIWDPRYDLFEKSKRDYPCTVMYDFTIRDDKLVMNVVMRSNDVVLGLGYDVFQHSRVQLAIASVLGVEAGDYRHTAISLHLYERDMHLVEQLLMPEKPPELFPALTGSTWGDVAIKATRTLNAGENPDAEWDRGADASFDWYADSIRKAVAKHAKA